MSLTASHDATTLLPYVAGRIMQLKPPDDVGEDNITVTITSVFPITMSPVMEVQIRTEEGFQEAILKVFDRRFGEVRKDYRYTPARPHTERTEVAWQNYVREGLHKALFDYLKDRESEQIKKSLVMYGDFEDDLHNDNDIPEWKNLGLKEGIIQYKIQQCYTNEIRAYQQLKPLQGRFIPQLMSPITINMPSIPTDLPPTYFQVPGILLQKIDGFNLADLLSHIPEIPLKCEQIIQSAADAAKEVNRAGVLNRDSAPRNVVIERDTFRPFLIDFAQSVCKCEYEATVDDPDPFQSDVDSYSNPRAVGLVMASAVKRATGYKPQINYD